MLRPTRNWWVLNNNRYTIGFIGWMVIITLLSLFSLPADVDGPTIDIPNLDKAVHFTFYFIAAILGSFFIRERTKGGLKLKNALFIIGCSVIIYGIIIEVFQAVFTAERTGDIYDALANTIGALCGVAMIIFLFSGKRQLKWKI